MTRLYNPKRKMRSEAPEKNKRLLVRDHSLLSQRFGINHNGKIIHSNLLDLITHYPLDVFRHIYEYKTRKLVRLRLCSVGYEMLFKMMDLKHPDIIDKHRARKRNNKARISVMNKLNDTN